MCDIRYIVLMLPQTNPHHKPHILINYVYKSNNNTNKDIYSPISNAVQ